MRRRRIDSNLELVLIAAVFLFIVVGCVGDALIQNSNSESITVTVLNAEAKIKSGEKSETYLISAQRADGEMEVFESSDSLLQMKYNSADVYFTLKNNIGKQFRIKVVGYRVPLLSWNRNIISIEGPLQ